MKPAGGGAWSMVTDFLVAAFDPLAAAAVSPVLRAPGRGPRLKGPHMRKTRASGSRGFSMRECRRLVYCVSRTMRLLALLPIALKAETRSSLFSAWK